MQQTGRMTCAERPPGTWNPSLPVRRLVPNRGRPTRQVVGQEAMRRNTVKKPRVLEPAPRRLLVPATGAALGRLHFR